MTLNETATTTSPSGPNVNIKYLDSILLRDPRGEHTSGLDASPTGPYITFPGFSSEIPSVRYAGDGFGGDGPGGFRVSLDSEGLALGDNGTFWISDEYGPYIYQFSHEGSLLQAIRPPDAFIPLRNGTSSFSSDSAPRYDPELKVIPSDNPTGRDNNQVSLRKRRKREIVVESRDVDSGFRGLRASRYLQTRQSSMS